MSVETEKYYCQSIASRVSDYREGEIRTISIRDVKKWVEQFDASDRLVILREMDQILERFYFSRERVKSSLGTFIRQNLIGGDDPSAVLLRTCFLRIQRKGNSQRDLLEIVDEILQAEYGTTLGACGRVSADMFVYIDDAILTGNRLRYDLVRGNALAGYVPNPAWITTMAPQDCTLKIFVLAAHTRGARYALDNVLGAAREKNISVSTHCAMCIPNERTSGCTSHDCLWPQSVPGSTRLNQYIRRMERESGWSISYRPLDTPRVETLFSSAAARGTVERAFLIKGVELIRTTDKDSMRPLGWEKLTSLGFGTFFVTYRNIPNNAPPVLWWSGGDWFPLFRRRDSDQQQSYSSNTVPSRSSWEPDDFDDVPF